MNALNVVQSDTYILEIINLRITEADRDFSKMPETFCTEEILTNDIKDCFKINGE